jgi:mRNA interferase MazF
MRRGEVWTAAGGSGYAGKPRPVVIVQDDRFDATASLTVCGFTTDPTDAPLFRLPIDPTEANGLAEPSRLMVDKITTVARGNLGRRIGRLADTDVLRLDRAIVVFLGLGGR